MADVRINDNQLMDILVVEEDGDSCSTSDEKRQLGVKLLATLIHGNNQYIHKVKRDMRSGPSLHTDLYRTATGLHVTDRLVFTIGLGDCDWSVDA
eukprot:562063-Prorocentrum_minimum.AAC.1